MLICSRGLSSKAGDLLQEQISHLTVDAEILSAQLAQLKTKAVSELLTLNAALKDMLQNQKRSFWGAYAMLSNQLRGVDLNPLSTYIRLTKDPAQRRETLMALYGQKITEARRFAIEQAQGLDLLSPLRRESVYMTPQGDFCCDRFDVTQFTGVKSLEQAYEAALFFMANIEISITEMLGHITLREDYDRVAGRISHHRLLSRADNGVMHEMNAVAFTQFVDQGRDNSYGVIMREFVDEDDLYPYQPQINMRKDVVAATLLTTHRQKKVKKHKPAAKSTDADLIDQIYSSLEEEQQQDKEDEEELVVVMRRGIYVKLHHTDLDLSDSVLRNVREGVARWNDVMATSMRDRLATNGGQNYSPFDLNASVCA